MQTVKQRIFESWALFKRHRKKYIAISLPPGAMLLAKQLSMIMPGEFDCRWIFMPFEFLALAGFILGLSYLPLAFLSMIVAIATKKPVAILLAGLFAFGFLFAIGGHLAGTKARMVAMRYVTNRGDALVTAINQFKLKNSRLPTSLSELVPEFIKATPHTGLCVYPDFEYSSRDDQFALRVFTSSGAINFDELVYSPDVTPETTDPTTKIGNWYYIHE